MKIRTDEHVAPAIVAAIRDVGLSDSAWDVSSVLQVGQQGHGDVHWITAFAKSGGEAILTADRDFIAKPPQVQAVFETGIKVIHLPPKWGQQSGDLQAAFVLLWWGRIERTLSEMKPRECYRPAWNLNTEGELKRVSLDFQKAQKRLKREKRKSGR